MSTRVIACAAATLVAALAAACGNSDSYQAGYAAATDIEGSLTHLQIHMGSTPSGYCSYLYGHNGDPSGNSTGSAPYDEKDYLRGCIDGVAHVMNQYGP
jgi:hypothetical protein